MSSDTSNDNTAVAPVDGDAHGHAAILLVESRLHGLIARKIISTGDAVEIVDVAADVKADTAGELGESPLALRKSLGLHNAISSSLRRDPAGN